MEALGAIATRHRKFIHHLGKLGGPKWLRGIWQVEMKNGSTREALVLDRAFRKRLELDDFKARDLLSRFDFQRVLKKHRAGFADGLLWSEFRAIPKSANLRDLIFFHDFPDGSEHMPTPRWRVINVNNRKTLLHLLKELDEGGNVEQWLNEPGRHRLVKATAASTLHSEYVAWCKDRGHAAASAKKFSRQLTLLGIHKKRATGGYIYLR